MSLHFVLAALFLKIFETALVLYILFKYRTQVIRFLQWLKIKTPFLKDFVQSIIHRLQKRIRHDPDS
jgi:hypothetical protein